LGTKFCKWKQCKQIINAHTDYKGKRENAVSLIYLSLTFALEEKTSRLPYYLIILFPEMLKFSNFDFFQIKILWKKIMNFPKLINYSTDMCWNGQGTMVLLFTPRKKFTQFDWGKLQNFDLTLPLTPNREQKHIFNQFNILS
jgi:hypothetical protein